MICNTTVIHQGSKPLIKAWNFHHSLYNIFQKTGKKKTLKIQHFPPSSIYPSQNVNKTFFCAEKVKNQLPDLFRCYSSSCCFLTPDIWLPTRPVFTPHFSLWQPHCAPAVVAPVSLALVSHSGGKQGASCPFLVDLVYAWHGRVTCLTRWYEHHSSQQRPTQSVKCSYARECSIVGETVQRSASHASHSQQP